MRVITLSMMILCLVTFGQLKSQDIPPPNPDLIINIVSGHTIEFIFDEMDEYINGISTGGHSTFVRVGSIYDWKLQFKADQMMFYGTNNSSNQMELNNAGLVIVSVGTNQDDGSNIVNYAKTVPVALTSSDVTVLTKGSMTNKGYGVRNSFSFNWEMGTKQGNMNNQSMLEQMLAADIYTVNVILTLSVY